MAHDLLSEYQQSELKRLARWTLSPLQLTIVVGLLSALVMVLAGALISAPGNYSANVDQRRELQRSGASWAIALANSQEEQADWLTRRGIGLERNLHARLSFRVLQGAGAILELSRTADEPASGGILSSLLGAGLRIGFLIIAATRLFLAFGVWAWWSSRTSATPYVARDALGQTGNGRLFFSGINVNLDERDTDGSPARQIAGLTCPLRAPMSSVTTSKIANTLQKFSASNALNLALTATILHYRQRPDHVAFPEDESRFEQSYETGSLGAYVEQLIGAVLSAHRLIVEGESAQQGSRTDEIAPYKLHETAHYSCQETYSKLIEEVLGRILSPRVRAAVAKVSAAEVATLCLALEAGKILLFAVESGKWHRRSHFPELSARAMLHSCPEFSETYSAIQRTRLRRALVFSGEPSVFAPIRLPQDLTLETRGLLGFSRILLAQPHELAARAANEELTGILAHIHFGFEKIFFANASELDPDLLEEAYTSNNVLLLKLSKVMTLLRQVIEPGLLHRLHELVLLTHSLRAEKELAEPDEDTSRPSLGGHDTILPPLHEDELNALANQYKLNQEELRDWSVLRLALHHFGWLGRRVSERTVPNSSIVFAVLKDDQRSDKLTGIEGVVPLRASRCREHWGKNWASRFIQVEWARIAESRRDYERLLSGEITDVVPSDEIGDDEPVLGVIS